eukprot:PLAT11824.1.p1 GENE.PLAT11824.1~~PLAT11824.1.p1  ORF type:complete len:327 (-),score=120.45 PLAT11824.1:41-961(-)
MSSEADATGIEARQAQPYYDVEEFPFLKVLQEEETWKMVRDEMQAALDAGLYSPWPEKTLYEDSVSKGWQVFGLYAFGGEKVERNCEACPRTTALAESIPGMCMAGFSALLPGTHIQPHCGYSGYSDKILRVHLGLRVPPKCSLRVHGIERSWSEGSVIVFDDSLVHEAWNFSEELRVLFILDFMLPPGYSTMGVMDKGFTPACAKIVTGHVDLDKWDDAAGDAGDADGSGDDDAAADDELSTDIRLAESVVFKKVRPSEEALALRAKWSAEDGGDEAGGDAAVAPAPVAPAEHAVVAPAPAETAD